MLKVGDEVYARGEWRTISQLRYLSASNEIVMSMGGREFITTPSTDWRSRG